MITPHHTDEMRKRDGMGPRIKARILLDTVMTVIAATGIEPRISRMPGGANLRE